MAELSLETVEIPEAWGTLDADGDPDAVADQQLSAVARQAVEALRRAAGDERSARAALMAFFRGWERVCEDNGSASDSDVRECVYAVFEELVNASGFAGRAPRWWGEACHGYLDVNVPGLHARLAGMAGQHKESSDVLERELLRIVADLRQRLLSDTEAALPGIGTFRRGRAGVVVHRWTADENRDPAAPPRAPVERCVSALLDDVQANGAVHVPGLGIVGREVLPAYEGRNPRTGETILVPEKSFFTCLLDEDLRRLSSEG